MGEELMTRKFGGDTLFGSSVSLKFALVHLAIKGYSADSSQDVENPTSYRRRLHNRECIFSDH